MRMTRILLCICCVFLVTISLSGCHDNPPASDRSFDHNRDENAKSTEELRLVCQSRSRGPSQRRVHRHRRRIEKSRKKGDGQGMGPPLTDERPPQRGQMLPARVSPPPISLTTQGPDVPSLESSARQASTQHPSSTEDSLAMPLISTNENERPNRHESTFISPEAARDAVKHNAGRTLAILVDDHNRRIHINNGTVDPDWEEILDLPLSPEKWVEVAEGMREVILSDVGNPPSCGFVQLVAISGMKSQSSFDSLSGRIETSLSDARMCPLGDVYSSLAESIEARFARISFPFEFQEKINRFYSLYETAVSSRVNLEPSVAIEVQLRARMNRMIRNIKSLTV